MHSKLCEVCARLVKVSLVVVYKVCCHGIEAPRHVCSTKALFNTALPGHLKLH